MVRHSVADQAPRTARRYRGGSLETVPLDEIAIGDVLLVAPGDVLPVDGAVTSGIAVLDESALTGEAMPVERRAGDSVRSGTVNAGGTLAGKFVTISGTRAFTPIFGNYGLIGNRTLRQSTIVQAQ